MLIPKRSYAAASGYWYGFNGKENDNDVKGLGNQQDYEMRIYDPRIGKFLSVDALNNQYPFFTPYQFAANNPLSNIDLEGLKVWAVNPSAGKLHLAHCICRTFLKIKAGLQADL